ncbi:MAG: succinate dehydrogenase, hydrophobic membrane anchor protein [Bdellovibrionales bacterium]
MSFANALKHTFTNHDGTGHKLAHNITTICNIPLAFWFVWSVFTLRNASFADLESYMSQPINLIAGVLFVMCALKHFALEIEVVFEDYISAIPVRQFAIIALKIFFLVLGVTATISLLKLGL